MQYCCCSELLRLQPKEGDAILFFPARCVCLHRSVSVKVLCKRTGSVNACDAQVRRHEGQDRCSCLMPSDYQRWILSLVSTGQPAVACVP